MVNVNRPTLTILASRSAVAPGGSALLTGYLKSRSGRVLARRAVALDRSFDGKTWKRYRSLKTSSTGKVAAKVRPAKTTYYRFRFIGDRVQHAPHQRVSEGSRSRAQRSAARWESANDQTGTVYRATGRREVRAGGITALADGPTGSVTINGGAAYTTSANVTLNSDVTGATEMRFTNDGTLDTETWEPYAATKSWTLAAGDGVKTVKAEYRDAALNVLAASDEITLDTAAPTGTISINGGAAGTNQSVVTLTLSASDTNDVPLMRFSNDGIFDTETFEAMGPPSRGRCSAPTAPTPCGCSTRTARATLAVFTDTIMLDTAGPTGTMTINNNATYTTSRQRHLELGRDRRDPDALLQRRRHTGRDWEPTDPKAWALAGADGTKTVYAEYRDAAGNVLATSDTIALDTAGPTGTMSINGGARTRPSAQRHASNSDVTGATQMRFSNDGIFGPDLEAYATSKAWALVGRRRHEDRLCRVPRRGRNVLATSDTITLDTAGPDRHDGDQRRRAPTRPRPTSPELGRDRRDPDALLQRRHLDRPGDLRDHQGLDARGGRRHEDGLCRVP